MTEPTEQQHQDQQDHMLQSIDVARQAVEGSDWHYKSPSYGSSGPLHVESMGKSVTEGPHIAVSSRYVGASATNTYTANDHEEHVKDGSSVSIEVKVTAKDHDPEHAQGVLRATLKDAAGKYSEHEIADTALARLMVAEAAERIVRRQAERSA